MHNPYDQIAKKVGKRALDPSGRTDIQHEISRDAQHADLRHVPDAAREAERARLGLLGRLAAVLCLIDVFAHALTGEDLRGSLSKHLSYWEERERARSTQNRKHREQSLPPLPVVEPFLWIIAADVSAPMLRKLGAEPAPSFPPGVYLVGGNLLRVGMVVASVLPRERSTLLVRIMTAGPLLPTAAADLFALPDDAHERAVAEEILLKLQRALEKKPDPTPEEEEFIMSMQGTWKEARALARDEGRVEEAARGVLTALRVRGIAVPDAARERILAEKDLPRLERWHERAVVATSITEVLDDPS